MKQRTIMASLLIAAGVFFCGSSYAESQAAKLLKARNAQFCRELTNRRSPTRSDSAV